MALVYNGNPLTGTADADFIIDIPSNAKDTTLSGLGGNDILMADFDFFFSSFEGYFGSTVSTAYKITDNLFPWSTAENAEIIGSTTVPHTSILFSGEHAGQAFWAVDVVAGAQISLDIDYGVGPSSNNTDTLIQIYDSKGSTLLASNDDNISGDVGSVSTLDSFLQHEFQDAGKYIIKVSELNGTPFVKGDDFFLHVSLTGQGVTNERPVFGNDTLIGGDGTDYMSGGGGNDTFIFNENDNSVDDYALGGSGVDTILASGGGSTSFNVDLGEVRFQLIEAIKFDTVAIGGTARMVFRSTQFGADNISDSATIQFSGVSSVPETLSILMLQKNLDLSKFTFTGNGVGDSVAITGLSNSVNIVGSRIRDVITTDAGKDTVSGGDGNDEISTGADKDILNGGKGADTLEGGAGDDTYVVDSAGDQINEQPGQGTDDVLVTAGDYTLSDNLENGTLLGGDDGKLIGNGLVNFLKGGIGANTLEGGASGDQLWGGLGADNHIGGNDAGIDYARYDDANYGSLTISLANPSANTGAAKGDTYNGIEGLVGGVGNDQIFGDAKSNYLFGGNGGDNLWGGAGLVADFFYGGDDAGIDYVRYDDANYGNLTIRLDAPAANTGVAKGDVYNGIEGLVGGVGNDTVIGNGAANYLFGGGGQDYIDGLAGNDYLNGGALADRFRMSTALNSATNVDRIADFQHGVDKILLTQAIFAGIGATLDAGEFKIGMSADANDLILYNPGTGQLFYDAGGNTGAGPVLFATVGIGTVLDAGDFTMV